MINIATGVLHFTTQDLWLPGQLNLVWGRYYSTALLDSTRLQTPFGPGWSNPYLATLTRQEERYIFVNGQGQTSIFTDPEQRLNRGGKFQDLGRSVALHFTFPYAIITAWSSAGKGHRLRYRFLATGKLGVLPLVSIENAAGQGLDLSYDDWGRLTQIHQRLEQRTLTLHYTNTSRLHQVTFTRYPGPDLVLAHYDYDAQGQLTSAFDALHQREHYHYDDQHRLV